jgi:FkbM family methyltransferase
MTMLHSVRKFARRLGLEVERATPMTQWRKRLPALLAQNRVDTVLDIGANDGGFASDLLEAGFNGMIYSFEPLPDAWERLRYRSLTYPGRWTVFPRIALSDRQGEVDFHEAGNSASSSLLVMTDNHLTAAPHTATVRSHRVTTQRLDDVLAALSLRGKIWLKLDVQGAEKLVLDGAPKALAEHVAGVQLEMSLTELYEGQALSGELDRYLRERGFHVWDIVPGFRDSTTLRLMQYDGIYVKP